MGYRKLLRGLNTSVTANAQAFGFSITITATFGVVSSTEGSPSLPEIFAFALAAVAAFSLLNLVTAKLVMAKEPAEEPDRVVLVSTATDFLAVGLALGAAVGVRYAVGGWGAWLLTPFAAAVVYVLMQALEITAGLHQADRADQRDQADEADNGTAGGDGG